MAYIAIAGSGTTISVAEDIAVDAFGNAFVAGSFGWSTPGSLDFDPSPTDENGAAATSSDAFLAKYTPSGELDWFWIGSGAGAAPADLEFSSGVASSPNGDVFVVGQFNGTLNIGGDVLLASGTTSPIYNHFIARFDSAGNPIWAKTSGSSTYSETASDISLDESGNAYVVGSFKGTVQFDPLSINPNTELTSTGDAPSSDNHFVVKYKSNGEIEWARTADLDSGEEVATNIVVDSDGNSYVVGYFSGTVDFDDSISV